MALEFRVGARLVPELIINKYVVYFSNMSGDSDHYTEVIMQFDGIEKMQTAIYLYITRWFMSEQEKYDDDLVLKNVVNRGISRGLTIEEATDLYIEMVEYDITDRDHLAIPDSFRISYFDNDGHTYMMELINNGQCIMNRVNEGNVRILFDEH
jgi:hypothetical protein